MSTEDNELNEDPRSPGAMSDNLTESDESFVAEEKKPVNRSTFVLFGIILAAMAGYYFMYVRTGPAPASAANPEVAEADQTIKTFLAAGDQNIKSMQAMLKNAAKVVEQFKSYPSMTQVPLDNLTSNPFQFVPLKTDVAVDDNRQHQADRDTALKAANALQMQIQSIFTSGTRKACMISNTLYNEGQQIDIFIIEKINPNSVVIRTGQYRFELKMQK